MKLCDTPVVAVFGRRIQLPRCAAEQGTGPAAFNMLIVCHSRRDPEKREPCDPEARALRSGSESSQIRAQELFDRELAWRIKAREFGSWVGAGD